MPHAADIRGRVRKVIKRIALKVLPLSVYRTLARRLCNVPPVGSVRLGDLRRLVPISRVFGFNRGQPVDRFYIENFLMRHATDIRGRVLEFGDNAYTSRFGGDRVSRSDIFHVDHGIPQAAFVGDLTHADHVPSGAFQCVILTQTLHLIYDLRSAVATLKRILTPDGVLLATVPGTISQLEEGRWASAWCWGFTALSVRKLFEEEFQPEQVCVETHGNVLTAIAFLEGLAADELRREERAFHDPLYPLLITIRATSSSPAYAVSSAAFHSPENERTDNAGG